MRWWFTSRVRDVTEQHEASVRSAGTVSECRSQYIWLSIGPLRLKVFITGLPDSRNFHELYRDSNIRPDGDNLWWVAKDTFVIDYEVQEESPAIQAGPLWRQTRHYASDI